MKMLLLRASIISFLLSTIMIVVITLFVAKSLVIEPSSQNMESLSEIERIEYMTNHSHTIEGKELFFHWIENPNQAKNVLWPDFLRLFVATWLAAFISGQWKNRLK
ncbi:MAG: hypothetical protein ACREPB_11800 [Arenimonas sp.]